MEEIASYIHPDDRERITWARDHGFGDGDSWEGEFRMHRADGATRYHHIRMQWRFDANGRPTTLMGTVQDVTERVEAEQSLRQTAQQLAEAERLAQVGSFTRDLRSDTAIWSDELYRIFGLPTTGPALDIAEIESYVHPDDLAQFRESRRTALRERRPWQGTFRVYRADGTLRVHQIHTQIRLGPDGQPEALIGAVQDVTDRTEAERELRKTASQLAEAERLAQVGYWEWEPETDRREWSEEVFRILDLPPDSEPTLETFMARVHPRDRAAVEAETTRNVEELAPIQHSYRIVTSDGAVRHLETIAQPVARGDGTVEKIVGAMRDITELVDAADRVRRGEATLRAVFENLPAAAALKDMDGRYIVANGRYSEWFGTPPRDMIGKTALEVFADEDDTPRVVAMDRTVADTGKAVQEDFEFTFADGSRRPCMALKFPVNGDDGEPIGIGLLLFDISERKRTRAALERSEATLRAVFENLPAAAALKDRDGRYVVANGRYDTWFGHDPVDMVGKTQHEVYTHAEDTGRSLALDAAVIEHGKAVQEDLEFNFADGSRRPVTCLKFPVTGGDGEPLGVGALTFDITERHRVREALERSEAQLRALFDNVLDLIAVVDGEGRILTQSPSTQAVIGYAEDEVAGQVCFDYVHPEDVEASRQALAGIVGNQGETASFRARAHHKDGRWRTMDFLARNALDVPGIEGIVVVGRDVTERLGLEEQLLQAQKMEAVGQLTGGLAHDFNNLLAIVIINLELAREDIADESPVALLLDKAVRAANRGASLTDTLLAFSRRQALSPQVIEPNRTIAGLLELIGGTLGESIDVRCRPADKVWRTRVDVAQLENALLNLAINARDAMPDGGILSIATANRPLSAAEAAAYDLAPGDYVEITVADTGHGIPAEILDRVAEPFFTTKDVGTGSGLGLSMAYGFARQSGGHLAIGSTPGDGVTVRLLLPRTQEAPTPEPIAVEPPPVQAERPLTILVVEDDADVRAATVANLKRLGYDVVSAADAAEALKILASERELALMFTDIVLPGGVNGTELATRARHLRRDLPILFASGYANTDLPPELIGDSVPLLKKPYRTAALAQAVYDCLGGGNERSTTPADRR